MAPIIQLGLDPQDDRLWWCDLHKWDIRDDIPDTVKRPTEQAAFRLLFRQSRALEKFQKRGILINLSPMHQHIMRMEQSALIAEPPPDNVFNWIAARIHGIPPLQVKAILDECSLVVLLRDALHMAPIVVDWPVREGVVRKAA